MRWLTEQQIQETVSAVIMAGVASEIADEAESLTRRAAKAGFVLEVHSVADEFGVVTIRPRAEMVARDSAFA